MRARAVALALVASCIACSSDEPTAEPQPEADSSPATSGSAQPNGMTAVPAAGSGAMQDAAAMTTSPPSGMQPAMQAGSGAAGSATPAGMAGAMAPADPRGKDPVTTDPSDDPEVDLKGGRIYWLDIGGNGVYSALADGSQMKRIAAALAAPDGVEVDDCTGDVFFSNMGSVLGNSGQASVQRARWDGRELQTLVKPGSGVNTAKQLTLDPVNHHVYFADREGAKIWRAKLDGSELTAVVSGHGFAQLVGVAVDPAGEGKIYFTDRNRGLVLRMGLQLPSGQTAENRDDVETLVESPANAMPIDLALDVAGGALYWTDRRPGTVKRVGLELPAGDEPSARSDEKVVVPGLSDPIGISLDVAGGRMYVTESNGTVHRFALDGSGDMKIAKTSSATGIAYARIGPDGEHARCD